MAVSRALAVGPAALRGVAGPGGFPGPLLGGAVVVEVPAAVVAVRVPVTQRVQREARGQLGQLALGDLQLLEVGVDGGVWATLVGGACLMEERGEGWMC